MEVFMLKMFRNLLRRFEKAEEKEQEDITSTTIYAMFLSFSLTLLAFLLAV